MQAYFETDVVVSTDHRLNLQLPDEIPPGQARIAVIYKLPAKVEAIVTAGNMDTFLAELPINEQGRSHADILRQIQAERDSWEPDA